VYANYLYTRPLSLKERLKGEKDTLGLYLTGHPIDEYESEVRRFAKQRIVDLRPSRELQTIAGLIVNQRVMRNKKGDKMAFITLDDRSGRIEASLFAEAFNQAHGLLQTDTLVVVEGEVSHDDFSGGLRFRAKRVLGLAEARTSLAHSLRLQLNHSSLQLEQIHWLKQQLAQYPGDCLVSVAYEGAQAKAELELAQNWKIEPKDILLQGLRDQFGQDNVFLYYP
jgi:DNA polymerase-3 subunit alpha